MWEQSMPSCASSGDQHVYISVYIFPPCICSQDGGSPRVLSEEEQLARQQARQSVFREYRLQRQAVLQLRNTDREMRNETKLQQLEMAEQWQVGDKCTVMFWFVH